MLYQHWGTVSPDPEKTSQIESWPMPQSAQDVQRFVGLANYYHRFIKSFATIAKPLHRLTEKGVVFSWTPECGHDYSFLTQIPVTLALELCFLSCKKTEMCCGIC